jgi:hypothetical protein
VIEQAVGRLARLDPTSPFEGEVLEARDSTVDGGELRKEFSFQIVGSDVEPMFG